jgi:hypothetical protein
MSANDKQVGGNHYRNVFQHWDLAHELDLGYFEGQITKYLTRHRFKKGKEDAEKALHFTEKLLELARVGARHPRHKFTTMSRMTEYAEANKLLPLEYACITSACNWMTAQDLEMLVERVQRLIRECYPQVPTQEQLFDSGEPGRGYVDQDR